VGEEEIAMQFAADVTEAVASVRELATSAQDLAATAKEAQDGVAGIAAPAGEAATATKELADSSTAAAAGADEVAASTGKAAGELGIYIDAAGRARLANGQFATSAQVAAAGMTEAATAAKGAADTTTESAAKSGAAADAAAGGGLGKYKMALVGVGVGAGVAVDAAVKFQAQTTRLVTSAGQSAQGLGQVQQGILQLSSQTGTSTEQLAQGMYIVESAGQHGAAGLEVLKAAAQGARAENANLETVADAVSSAMADYHQPASAAADITTKLVAATSAGKTSFEQLAGSMPAILPVASAAHVSLNDILGDLASMTLHGMSAQQASQNLADAIRHMQNPTSVQSKELALLGMNTTQLASDMKSSGLSGTINEISQRIMHMMPPGSDKVILQMKTALQGLSPEVRTLGEQLMNGQISMGDYNKAAKDLTGVQAGQASAFATLLKSTHQIGGAQVSGAQVAQNYGQAMAKAMGDATGLNVALMISGENSKNTAGAIKTVSDASVEAGNNVKGWGDITKTTSFQLAKAKDSAEAAGISLGMALLPAVNAVLVPLASFLSVIAGNKAAAIAFAVVIGGILAGAIGVKLAGALKDAKEGIKAAGDGLEWLAGKFKSAGKASEDAAETVETAQKGAADATKAAADTAAATQEADAAKGAAANVKAAEESADKYAWMARQAETASGEAAAAQETAAAEAATANEEAAAESSGSWVKAGVKQIAAAAVWVAQSAVKVATVVASNVAGAAAAAGAWVAGAAAQVASGVAWVAGAIGKVAVIVASNVAGAAVTAAAWVAANAVMLLGIGAVVALVVIAVVEIVKHWSSIVHGVEAAWRAVYSFVSKIVSDVVGFVREHWQLLVAILTGPIGLAVLYVVQHWQQIVSDTESFISTVTNTVSKFASDVQHFFESMINAVVNAVKSWASNLVSTVRGLFNDWLSLVTANLDRTISFFSQLPGRIMTAIESLPGKLVQYGKDLVNGLINGVESMGSALLSAIESLIPGPIKSVVSTALGLFSPSRVFHGYGQNIVQGLINGVRAAVPDLHAAMGLVTGTVSGAGSSLAAGAVAPAGGSTSVHVSVPVNLQGGTGTAAYQDPAFQQYMQAQVQEAVLRYGQINPSNGLTPAWGR
jgi:hypothetical protein